MRPTAAGFYAFLFSLAQGVGGCGGGREVPGSLGQEVRFCPGPSTLEGIDVSQYQGGINWGAVKGSGRAFAIARVGDGLYVDPTFAANWSGIKSAGMVRSAYQFFRPGTDPNAQADLFLSKIGALGPGDLPPMLDVEATDGQPANVIASHVQTWINRVTSATGRAPMVYTGKYFWQDNVGLTIPGNPLVLAAWVAGCPDTPSQWDHWTFWQYADNGSVSGIGGAVDLDRFNGTQTDLTNLAGGAEWSARFVSQSFPYAMDALTMTAGQRVAAYIEMRNVGTRTWDGATRIALTQSRDRKSAFFDSATWLSENRLAGVSGTVAPGGTFRFAFFFHAPQSSGNYHEHFGMVQEGVHWFSDPGQGGPPDNQLEVQINVVSAPPPPPDLRAPEPDAATPSGDLGLDGGVGGDEGPTGEIQGGCACQATGRGGIQGPGGTLALLLLCGLCIMLWRSRLVR